jgi:hypothetical protein
MLTLVAAACPQALFQAQAIAFGALAHRPIRDITPPWKNKEIEKWT